MTWRRGSGRAVGSVGVDGGTSVDSGVTPGSERQSARPLFLPPPDCQMLEFRVFFPLLSMTYLWFACFTATVACWGFNQREKKKNFSLVELSVGWWVGDSTVADSLGLGTHVWHYLKLTSSQTKADSDCCLLFQNIDQWAGVSVRKHGASFK